MFFLLQLGKEVFLSPPHYSSVVGPFNKTIKRIKKKTIKIYISASCRFVEFVTFLFLYFPTDTRRASHVVVFFCKHVYHEDCLPVRDVVRIISFIPCIL